MRPRAIQKIKIVISILQIVAAVLAFAQPVFATGLDSTNYKIIDFDTSQGGGRGTSTNYSLISNIELVIDAQKIAPTATSTPQGGGGGQPPTPPPTPDTTAPVISNVQAINITTSKATITWDTNELANSTVEYGLTSILGSQESSAAMVTSHSVDLTGLSEDTTYHFLVKSTDSSGNLATSADFTFKTLKTAADATAPVISNVQVTNITGTSATITWDTNESADSTVDYGLDTGYGSTKTSATLSTSHQITLTGLTPDTIYHFQVSSTDASGNTATSDDQGLETLDTVAPTISNIKVINITEKSADITWITNEATTSQIFYRRIGTTSYSEAVDSSFQVSHLQGLTGLIANVSYEFYIIAKDAAGNSVKSSANTFTTLKDNIPPSNIKNFTATPDDGLNVLTWQNPTDSDYSGVYIVRSSSTYPKNKFDGDFVYVGSGISVTDSELKNGVTYYYTGFAYDTSGNYASGAITQGKPNGPLLPEEEEEIKEEEKIPEVPAQVNLDAVSFYVAKRTIQIYANQKGDVETLAGVGMGISLEKDKTPEGVKIVTLRVENSNYLMKLRTGGDYYDADIGLPGVPDAYKGEITLVFEKSQQTIDFTLDLVPSGMIYEKQNGLIKPINGATITLYELKEGSWQVWSGANYFQDNPAITDSDGAYGYLVLNGTFYLKVKKDGYRDNTTNRFDVKSNYINTGLELVAKPKKLLEVIKSEETILKNIAAVTKNLSEQTAYTTKIIEEEIIKFAQNPIVENTVSNIAAPSLISVAVINAAAAIPFLNFWTYLQYLLTQPLLFFKRKKRKAWGVVYNAYTKLPIDLAIVRLQDAKTDRIVRTVVTDKQGRYVLFAPEGEFKLSITKPGFQFPSVYLTGKKEDEAYVDLYHGGKFEIKQDGQAIAYNIPLDPMERRVSARILIATRFLKGLQYGLALSGITLTTVALIIAPSVKMGVFLAVHIALFMLFVRLAKPAKFKKWGMVRDAITGKALKNVVVRLFEPEYNKLLGTQITNSKGRYAFLVGRNIYYLSFEKAGYKTLKTKKIDTRTKAKAGVITEKVKMEKQ